MLRGWVKSRAGECEVEQGRTGRERLRGSMGIKGFEWDGRAGDRSLA